MDVEESGAGPLDLLLLVAENLKLLILGPLVVGVLVWGAAHLIPKSYVSQALLGLPAPTMSSQAATMMVSPIILDSVIGSLNYMQGQPAHIARARLASQIKISIGKDGLLRLEVTADDPSLSQSIANAVIDTWLKSTVPPERDQIDLGKRLSYAQNALDTVTRLINRLDTENVANLSKPLSRGEAGTSMLSLGELQSRYLLEVLSIGRQLLGLTRDYVKQPPTFPMEAISPKKSLLALGAAISTELALLLWLFIRQSWRNSAQDRQSAEKQNQIYSALKLKTD